MNDRSAPSRRRKTITRHYGETLLVSLLIMVLLSGMLIVKDRRVYKTEVVNADASILANSTVAYYSYLVSVMLRSDAAALEKYLHQIRVEEQLEAIEFVRPGATADLLLSKCQADNTAKKIAGYIPSCHFLEGNQVRVLQEFTSGTRTLGYLVKARRLVLTPSVQYFVQRPLLLVWLICLVIFGIYYLRQLHAHLVRPLALIARKTEKLAMNEKRDYKLHEIHHLAETLSAAQAALVERSRLAAIGEMASQVAHDIRSPLTALKVVAGHLEEVAEDKRVLIRNAVQRIEDIANNLAERKARPSAAVAGPKEEQEALSVQLLSSLIEPLISEKRSQFRHRLGVQIQCPLAADAYGLFARIQPTEFKRVLSNLVNNAVEALADSGTVTVALTPGSEGARITVADTGKGIPPERLPHLMQRGATFDKSGGSGLGLAHAKTAVAQWGGTLELASVVGQGTTVTITLPRAQPPAWFVPELPISAGTTIVVIDDDPSIHDVWEKRLAALSSAHRDLRVEHFSSGTAVCQWYANQPAAPYLFLCDYELLGEPSNGLDLIERLGIQDQTILVTSRYEESGIQDRCAKLGVQLLPKGLAGSVPIRWRGTGPPAPATDRAEPPPADGYRVLVIDDDACIRETWAVVGRRLHCAAVHCFASYEACVEAGLDLRAVDIAFVDKNIEGSRHSGAAVVALLKAAGVPKVVLASGENVRQLRADPALAHADFIVDDKLPESFKPFFS